MWAAGSEAATAQSAAVAQDCATIMDAEDKILEPYEADRSDVENVDGSEQVLFAAAVTPRRRLFFPVMQPHFLTCNRGP
jgi:hypothetical protein